MNEQLIRAMDLAKAGDWDAAHDIAHDIDSPEAARIHAYLHRVEGDDGNAAYWYRRAGVDFPSVSLDQEWQLIYNCVAGEDAG